MKLLKGTTLYKKQYLTLENIKGDLKMKTKEKKVISIKLKLMIFTIALIISLMITNLAAGLLTSYQGILKNTRDDLTSIGEVADMALSAKLESLTGEIQRAVDTADTVAATASDTELGVLAETNGWRYLALADSDGKITKGPSALRGNMVPSEDLFQRALHGKTVMSSPFTDETGEFVINVYIPRGREVLIAGVDGMYLSNMVADLRVGKTGNIFIVDKTGTMIANMRPQLVEEGHNFIKMAKTDKSYASAAKVFSKMIAGKTGVGSYTYGGVERYCYYAPIEGSADWYFGVAAPIKEMTTSIYTVALGMVIVSIIIAIFGIFISIWFAKKIANPIMRITNRMKLLSEGDLTEEVPKIKSRDEIGELASSIDSSISTLSIYVEDITRNMEEIAAGNLQTGPGQDYIGDFKRIETAIYDSVENLSETLALINTAAEQVSAGSEQVSSGAQALASGSAEQAASVEELSSSITLIADQAEENSANVKQATEYVGQAGVGLNDGNEHMKKLTGAMAEIDSSSKQITGIIKVIEDIAFQTNILALNAAVEAARAGDAGKGFAVVADEVRNLAAKSAEAAKQTTALIQHTVSAVAEGAQITTQTAQILHDVEEKAVQATESIVKIEQASIEQTSAIEQIKQGLNQVSAVVQTNAATAEENSATSEEMSAQAAVLRQEVGKFKLHNE